VEGLIMLMNLDIRNESLNIRCVQTSKVLETFEVLQIGVDRELLKVSCSFLDVVNS
jgi:hypothetical protein